jgi:hypothetical protein
MSDLSEYFSKQDRIKELEAELVILKRSVCRFHEREYETNKKIELLTGKKKPTRTIKAITMIKKTNKKLKEIAKECSLSYGYVKLISSNVSRGIY